MALESTAGTQKQVVASPKDTRRWSTDFTTQLAYMTMVQQTTSFLTGFRRLRFLPEDPPAAGTARRALR